MSLIPLKDVCCEFEKKNFGSRRGTLSESLVFGLLFFFFGQFSTEGTDDKSVSVTQTEVDL